MKIGGLSLSEDMERLRVIREVIGDAADLMLGSKGPTWATVVGPMSLKSVCRAVLQLDGGGSAARHVGGHCIVLTV